jgi:hypothetical protein
MTSFRAALTIAFVTVASAACGVSVPQDIELGQVAACQRLSVHLVFNDDSATCLLQDGISPAHLLPESVFRAEGRNLREVLSAYPSPIRRHGNGTKWYVLTEPDPHLETACLPVGAARGEWCSWRLASRALPPELIYPEPMAKLLEALVTAGMSDGRVLVDTSIKNGEMASEFIVMMMNGRRIEEVIWHDVPVMKSWKPGWPDAGSH